MRAIGLSLLLLALAATTPAVLAECPILADVPVMNSPSAFNCARIWVGHGDDDAIQACNGDCEGGEHYDAAAGADADPGVGYYEPVGSILVLPGCTFTGFEGNHFEGDIWNEFRDQLVPRVSTPVNCNSPGCCSANGYRSYKCRCDQRLISCSPTEGLATILTCDNSDGLTDISCSYSQTIGTSFTTDVVEHLDISASVAFEIKAGFFGIFSSTFGASADTDYDWTQTSSATQSEQTTITLDTPVTAGTTQILEQAMGHCNGNAVNTDFLKITTSRKDGSVVSVRYQRTMLDGTVVLMDEGEVFAQRA